MAQKDIQELAKYMESLEQDKKQYEAACDEAAKEAAEAIAEEFDAFEDEVIDKASLGFIDDDEANEADQFYAEDDKDNTFEEDVSDCLEDDSEPIDESLTNGSIEIEVFNDDGFGEHFTKELMKAVPAVTADTLRRKTETGDIPVRISGDVEELKKAFAFWTGNSDFNSLSNDDKDLFNSLLVFDNGDTLAEADYREAVAHCLDPIDVKASTANLIGKDACALSIIKEEKAKRQAQKMAKALKENDLSKLSDKELEDLQDIIDGEMITSVDQLSDDERRLMTAFANTYGYSLEDWFNLPDDKKEKIMKAADDVYKISKTGFADIHTATRKDGSVLKYRVGAEVVDPETGEKFIHQFNPYYTSDDSLYQHPSMIKRMDKENRKKAEQAELDARAKKAMKNARGKDTWDVTDLAQMTQNLSDKERKNFIDAMIKDIEEENSDPTKAAREIAFVRSMFGKKKTYRDLAAAWNVNKNNIQALAERLEGAMYEAARNLNMKLPHIMATHDKRIKERFVKEIDRILNSTKLSSRNPVDPEREERKRAFKAQQQAAAATKEN